VSREKKQTRTKRGKQRGGHLKTERGGKIDGGQRKNYRRSRKDGGKWDNRDKTVFWPELSGGRGLHPQAE